MGVIIKMDCYAGILRTKHDGIFVLEEIKGYCNYIEI